jgi:glycosyltransferase involved in cell wall biosynthesis
VANPEADAAGEVSRDDTPAAAQTRRREHDLSIDVSVVICTYTEARWGVLCQAIESVLRQTNTPRDVVLVVDHNERLAKRVRATWPDLVVVDNREGAGLSGSRNTGVATSRGSVVAFLDDDAVADPDWLERIVTAYEQSAALAVGGQITALWESGRPAWFPEEFAWVVGCTYRGLPTVRRPVRNVIGANMSVKREAFDVVGTFHAGVGRTGTTASGCEETELCVRIGRRWPGPVILYDPEIRVRHHVFPARARWRYFVSRCYAEGRSKAVVAALAGGTGVLKTEASYATRVLPAAVLREVRAALTQRDGQALARAGVIVVGLATTTAGFLAGRMGRLRSPEPARETSPTARWGEQPVGGDA